MKKKLKELFSKSLSQLEREADELRKEIIKIKMEKEAKPIKDSNLLLKKRKKLAQILTIISEKKAIENLNKTKS